MTGPARAVAPDVVFTGRMYSTRPLYGPRLVRKSSSHELKTQRSAHRDTGQSQIVAQLRKARIAAEADVRCRCCSAYFSLSHKRRAFVRDGPAPGIMVYAAEFPLPARPGRLPKRMAARLHRAQPAQAAPVPPAGLRIQGPFLPARTQKPTTAARTRDLHSRSLAPTSYTGFARQAETYSLAGCPPMAFSLCWLVLRAAGLPGSSPAVRACPAKSRRRRSCPGRTPSLLCPT
jgi:hypothetical protein